MVKVTVASEGYEVSRWGQGQGYGGQGPPRFPANEAAAGTSIRIWVLGVRGGVG